MCTIFEPAFAQLSPAQLKIVGTDLDTYFNEFKNSPQHIELILFTVQLIIPQNNRFERPDAEDFVEKLGVAGRYFSRTIEIVAKLIEADPSWYQPWLVRITPELEAHAKKAQCTYLHFSHLAEPPLHMGAWAIYAIAKSVEAALGLSEAPESWRTATSFAPDSDELLIVEFMSQLILRFLEAHRTESHS